MPEDALIMRSSAHRKLFITLLPLLAVLVIGAGLAVFKAEAIGLTPNSDYLGYLETANLFRGVPDASVVPSRILKPLNPLIVAAGESLMTPAASFVAQMVIFYFLFLFACYFLGCAFGLSAVESAILALVLGVSYPALKYGVDLYTETGAWFFYIVSFAFTLKYLRAPTRRLLFANAAVITLGFLWKEYSAISAAVFGLAILFHPALSRRAKLENIALYVGMFLAVNLAWEVFVYLHYQYTYLSWYRQANEAGGFAT